MQKAERINKINNKPTLVLITEGFPLDKYSEPYLYSEFDELKRKFSVTVICQGSSDLNNSVKIDGITVHSYQPKLTFITYLLALFSLNLFKEFKTEYHRTRKVSLGKIKIAWKYLAEAVSFDRWIIDNNIKASIYYSYWITPKTLGISFNSTRYTVSRAHGFDVYFERHPFAYLPFRSHLFKSLNYLSFISQAGRTYSESVFSGIKNSFQVNRLGLGGESDFIELNTRNTLHIVSCSSIIALKRVHLIVQFLESYTGDIKWTHIGSGALEQEIKELALPVGTKSNVEIEFLGHLKNSDVLRFYQEFRPDLFINVSETEGLPFSIIEAYSCSIPALAPNVGGIKEILVGQEFTLLEKDNINEGLKTGISQYSNFNEDQKNEFRKLAYSQWKNSFRAPDNYSKFIEDIMSTYSR